MVARNKYITAHLDFLKTGNKAKKQEVSEIEKTIPEDTAILFRKIAQMQYSSYKTAVASSHVTWVGWLMGYSPVETGEGGEKLEISSEEWEQFSELVRQQEALLTEQRKVEPGTLMSLLLVQVSEWFRWVWDCLGRVARLT